MSFTQRDKASLLADIIAAYELFSKLPVDKSCLDCRYAGDNGFCRLWHGIPPAEVQKIGCDSHVYDPTSPPF